MIKVRSSNSLRFPTYRLPTKGAILRWGILRFTEPTPQFIQPCFTSSKFLLDFPIVGKTRIFKIRMISADSAEWELVKLS